MARLISVLMRFTVELIRRVPALFIALFRSNQSEKQRVLGETIAAAAEALGPVYTKMAQMISYRNDLLPDSFLAPLGRLQEKATPEAASTLYATLESALGAKPADIFQHIDPVLLGAGSIASVIKARLRDGTWVAVKVARRNIRSKMDRDVASMRKILRLVARLPQLRGVPVLETYDRIAEMIAAQADMEVEAAHLLEFSGQTTYHDGLVFPKSIPELVRRDVLVMECVLGAVPISDSSLSERDFRKAASILLSTLYRMIFERGLVHCDLHPGNVLVSEGGLVTLIDAGLVARLSDADRRCFRDFFLAFVFGDSTSCAETFVRAAISKPDTVRTNELRTDVVRLIARHQRKRAGEFLVAKFVYEVFLIQRQHRLYASPGFASAIWALVMYEGLVRKRIPDLDFQVEAKPFMTGAIIDMIRHYNGSNMFA